MAELDDLRPGRMPTRQRTVLESPQTSTTRSGCGRRLIGGVPRTGERGRDVAHVPGVRGLRDRWHPNTLGGRNPRLSTPQTAVAILQSHRLTTEQRRVWMCFWPTAEATVPFGHVQRHVWHPEPVDTRALRLGRSVRALAGRLAGTAHGIPAQRKKGCRVGRRPARGDSA
jgi:hypothetical protein